jgi:hypothetical protein
MKSRHVIPRTTVRQPVQHLGYEELIEVLGASVAANAAERYTVTLDD